MGLKVNRASSVNLWGQGNQRQWLHSAQHATPKQIFCHLSQANRLYLDSWWVTRDVKCWEVLLFIVIPKQMGQNIHQQSKTLWALPLQMLMVHLTRNTLYLSPTIKCSISFLKEVTLFFVMHIDSSILFLVFILILCLWSNGVVFIFTCRVQFWTSLCSGYLVILRCADGSCKPAGFLPSCSPAYTYI